MLREDSKLLSSETMDSNLVIYFLGVSEVESDMAHYIIIVYMPEMVIARQWVSENSFRDELWFMQIGQE